MLRRDGQTQARTSLNPDVVEEYAELMLAGVTFPPVRACFDGTNYWLTDGFHRIAAVETIALENIRVEIFHGSLADAQWDSYQANFAHGLRRTKEDLNLILACALRHEHAFRLSNRELARHLQVSETTVRRARANLSAAPGADERVVIRKGRQYKIHVANIGKTRKAGQAPEREVHAALERRLAADLLLMDREAGPDVRRILRIFTNWTQRGPSPCDVLQALEQLVRELRGCR